MSNVTDLYQSLVFVSDGFVLRLVIPSCYSSDALFSSGRMEEINYVTYHQKRSFF